MNSNEYRCAMCKGTFNKGWSDEDAAKEAQDIWGTIPEDEKEVVCDDCFNQMNSLIPPTKMYP